MITGACLLPAAEGDFGAPMPATLHGFNLQFTHQPDSEQGYLQLQVTTRFPDAQLLGWRQIRLIEAVTLDGQPLAMSGTDENSAPHPSSTDNQDDLRHPLSLSFVNLSWPPTGFKRLRIAALDILAGDARRRLVLPLPKPGASFAPEDQPTAIATYLPVQGAQIRLALTESLLDRTVRITCRGPAGEVPCNVYPNNRRGNGSELLINPQNAGIEGLQPVLELADKIERRAVVLSLDNLDFYSDQNGGTTLLPLQKLGEDGATSITPIPVPTPADAVAPGARHAK
jgi:hypothetical protein